MRIRTPLLAAAAATTMLAGAALPASAATGDTLTTFTMNAGFFSVSPSPTAALNAPEEGQDLTVGVFDVVGSLGTVTVVDERGVGDTGWGVSATSTIFDLDVPITVGDSPPVSITKSTGVSYGHGPITPTGVTTTGIGSPAAVPLSLTAAPVVTGTLATGSNTATWSPELTVSMPATARAGLYHGTVFTSFS